MRIAPKTVRYSSALEINISDIIVDDDDIYGDGVNVAARSNIGGPGGNLYIHAAPRIRCRDKVPVKIETRGEQTVKNIARPIEVFCIIVEDRNAISMPPPRSRDPRSDTDGRRQAIGCRAALREYERR